MSGRIELNSSSPYASPRIATPSAPAEVLPIDVLNDVAYLEASGRRTVAARIELPEQMRQARSVVEAAFGSDYVRTISELDIDDEIQYYNRIDAHERVTFLDWYTLRDYKVAGYTRVNRPLKDFHDCGHARPGAAGTPLRADTQALVSRLYSAMVNAGGIQKREIQRGSSEPIDYFLYSGTDMSRAALNELEPGSVYEYPAFLSTSIDEDTARSFIVRPGSQTGAGAVPGGAEVERVGVLYEIETAPDTKALDFFQIFRDVEEEVLFPPGTKFVVRDIQENESGVLKVSMSELQHEDVAMGTASASPMFESTRRPGASGDHSAPSEGPSPAKRVATQRLADTTTQNRWPKLTALLQACVDEDYILPGPSSTARR